MRILDRSENHSSGLLTDARSEGENRSYRPDIDGLRAIAILSVILFHIHFLHVAGGFAGVDVFFVISGYLIGGHIFGEICAEKFSFQNFYKRRAKRILPAFYAMLAFVIVMCFIFLSPSEASDTGLSGLTSSLSISNFQFMQGPSYFNWRAERNPLLMTWSLAIEEQFYLVVPVVMVLLGKFRRNWLLPVIVGLCGLSLAFASAQLFHHQSMVFYMLPSRAWELGTGVSLAVLAASKKYPTIPMNLMGTAGMLLVIPPFFILSSSTLFPGLSAVPTVMGTALVLASPGCWINRSILSSPPMRFVGKISYSWYLWHWPLLTFAQSLYPLQCPLSVRILAVTLAFGAAVASYYLVEQPFRNSSRPAAPLLVRYAVVSAAFILVCGFIWRTDGIAQRSPLMAVFDSQLDLDKNPCFIENGSEPRTLPACYELSSTQGSLAVWGDSQSAALAPGFRRIATSSGLGFVNFSKSACLPVIGLARYDTSIPAAAADCAHFNQTALQYLKDPRIKIVVMVGRWGASISDLPAEKWTAWLVVDPTRPLPKPTVDSAQELLRDSVAKTVSSLEQSGKVVIVVREAPSFNFDPVLRVRVARIPMRSALARLLHVNDSDDPGFSAPYPGSINNTAEKAIGEALAQDTNATLLDLEKPLCGDIAQCFYRNDRNLFFSDTQHLTPAGAQFALRDFHLPSMIPN